MLKEWMSTAKTNANTIIGLEQKIRHLNSEKRDLELLITKYIIYYHRIYGCLPNSDMQKIISDMVKAQKELHIILKDKAMNDQYSKIAIQGLNDTNNYAENKQKVSELKIQGGALDSQIGIIHIK